MSNMKAHIRIVLDSVVLFDGELDEWVSGGAPDALKDALRPDARPQPWMKGILVAMADAALVGDDVTIEAWTPSPDQPGRWAMEVIKCNAAPPAAASLPAVS